MDSLFGKVIWIGREPQKSRLLLAVKSGDGIKTATIGDYGCVSNCVSCCKPNEDTAHCKITMGQDGTMIIHNLKPQNVTYVNGLEVDVKKLSNQCKVTLGKDKYPIDIEQITEAVRNIVGYSISHLEKVWEDYDNALYRLQKRQKNLGLIKSLYMPCTVLTGLIGYVFKSIGVESSNTFENMSMGLYVIAAIVLFYGLYRTITDRSIEDRKLLDKKFQEDYVCPKCKHFLGVRPYKILRQDEFCQYNKCKWAE